MQISHLILNDLETVADCGRMADIQHNTASVTDSYVTACVCASESALTLFDFVCRSVDENVERPHHAGDGDDVEGDRTHDLPPLARRHL